MNKLLSFIHIYGGFASLLLFWFPLILKKGSPWHKRMGIAFSVCMVFVIITAAFFSVHHLIKHEYPIGLGFSFLSLLTTRTLIEGFMAARLKSNFQRIKILINFLVICIAIVTIVMLVVGFLSHENFLLILGGIDRKSVV